MLIVCFWDHNFWSSFFANLVHSPHLVHRSCAKLFLVDNCIDYITLIPKINANQMHMMCSIIHDRAAENGHKKY